MSGECGGHVIGTFLPISEISFLKLFQLSLFIAVCTTSLLKSTSELPLEILFLILKQCTLLLQQTENIFSIKKFKCFSVAMHGNKKLQAKDYFNVNISIYFVKLCFNKNFNSLISYGYPFYLKRLVTTTICLLVALLYF